MDLCEEATFGTSSLINADKLEMGHLTDKKNPLI